MLTHSIGRSGNSVAVSDAPVLLSRAQQGGARILRHPASTTEMVLNRDVLLLSREQGWRIAQGTLKRGHASSCTGHTSLRHTPATLWVKVTCYVYNSKTSSLQIQLKKGGFKSVMSVLSVSFHESGRTTPLYGWRCHNLTYNKKYVCV